MNVRAISTAVLESRSAAARQSTLASTSSRLPRAPAAARGGGGAVAGGARAAPHLVGRDPSPRTRAAEQHAGVHEPPEHGLADRAREVRIVHGLGRERAPAEDSVSPGLAGGDQGF